MNAVVFNKQFSFSAFEALMVVSFLGLWNDKLEMNFISAVHIAVDRFVSIENDLNFSL